MGRSWASLDLGTSGRGSSGRCCADAGVTIHRGLDPAPPCHTARVPDVELSKVANCFIPSAATPGNMLGPARWAVGNYGKRTEASGSAGASIRGTGASGSVPMESTVPSTATWGTTVCAWWMLYPCMCARAF